MGKARRKPQQEHAKERPKTPLQKAWHFLWHEDSLASWVVSVALAFLLIKFAVYPVLGLTLGTTFPVVAVVSDSMEHNEPFDDWWARHEELYLQHGVTKEEFREFPMRSGFDKGDIILLVGAKPGKVEVGDIIVFWGGKAYPIIHRVVAIGAEQDGTPFYQTKGDNNLGQIVEPPYLDERHVPSSIACRESDTGRCDVVLGRAALRIPYLGWVKIWFVSLLQWMGVPVA